jgi:hypothetical protein
MFGRLSASSFDPPPKEGEPDAFTLEHENSEEAWKGVLARYPVVASSEKALQMFWNKLDVWWQEPSGVPCYDCRFLSDCVSLNIHHTFLCAFMPHNGKDPVLSAKGLKSKRISDAVHALAEFSQDFEKINGREPTKEELKDLVQEFQLALQA